MKRAISVAIALTLQAVSAPVQPAIAIAQPPLATVPPALARPFTPAAAGATPPGNFPRFTHELVVRVEPSLSPASRQRLWQKAGVREIRPLRFAQATYLVTALEPGSLAAPAIAQNLQTLSGIIAAEPNWVQTTAQTGTPSTPAPGARTTTTPMAPDLARAAWYIDSTPLRGSLQPRTDIQATAAWEISRQGTGTTVAIIDSTLQLNHPDLQGALACPKPAIATALEGETCGWDFAQDDPQTSLSPDELETLRFDLQNSFRLSDRALLATYQDLAALLKGMPRSQQATIIRQYLQAQVQSVFHGTWVAGVIAARSNQGGLQGVAPQASILPVRVFDLEGQTTTATLIEATGYAAARDVDVINLSLGSLVPSEALTYHLFHLLDADPNLVIVASAGNANLDGVGFPAAIPGIISVGATTLEGQRAPYSQYGGQLSLVAPGGDTQQSALGGILTTGGTWLPELWEGMPLPQHSWGLNFDAKGTYVQVQGTSFAAPNVSGIVALIKGEAPDLSRAEVLQILQDTASHEALSLSAVDEMHYRLQVDEMHYRLQKELGFGTILDFPFVRGSGIYQKPEPIGAEQYYFGAGLVNAVKAVKAAQQKTDG